MKLLPKRLKKGDTIGIVAPSKALTDEHKRLLEGFKAYMEDLGFNIVLSKNIFASTNAGICAGTPEQRADDINEMFKNPKIDVIWCYQGGQPANQILDLLDYDSIKANPKLFMGMSDIDTLLLAINKMTGLITFNTPDSKIGRDLDMNFEYSQNSFKKRMMDGSKEIKPNSEWITLKKGSCKGKLLGCNINILSKLGGTKYFPDFTDAILFIEGYHVTSEDALWKLQQLKLIGVFDKIKGVVIGYMHLFETEKQPIKFEDLVLEATKEYDFPILKINEFGHRCQNAFLPIGADVEVDATNKTINITEDFIK